MQGDRRRSKGYRSWRYSAGGEYESGRRGRMAEGARLHTSTTIPSLLTSDRSDHVGEVTAQPAQLYFQEHTIKCEDPSRNVVPKSSSPEADSAALDLALRPNRIRQIWTTRLEHHLLRYIRLFKLVLGNIIRSKSHCLIRLHDCFASSPVVWQRRSVDSSG